MLFTAFPEALLVGLASPIKRFKPAFSRGSLAATFEDQP